MSFVFRTSIAFEHYWSGRHIEVQWHNRVRISAVECVFPRWVASKEWRLRDDG